MQILLNKSNSKKSVNVNNSLSINLKGRKRVLPIDKVITDLNENDLYNQERQTSTTFRLTCTINPICTNVLFNNITEIVKNEGGDNVELFHYGATLADDNIIGKDSRDLQTTYDAVRDTQLSNQTNGFEYKCGIDIFNNHLLRSLTFKAVCPTDSKQKTFNTIEDKMRSLNGNQIRGYKDKATVSETKDLDMHIYLNEEILSFKEAVSERLIEENGWWGFKNIGKVLTYDVDNGKVLDLNKVINSKKPCDFIDMYPSRDLYYFTPKYNPYRHRVEKNWNYCLTYPSSSTTKMDFINKELNSLKTIFIDDSIKTKNDLQGIKIYSISKHGLKEGDVINLYKDDEAEPIKDNLTVHSIEDDYVFTVVNQGNVLSHNWREITKDEFQKHKLIYTYQDNGKEKTKTYEIDLDRTKIYNGQETYFIVENKKVNIGDDLKGISYKRVVDGVEVDYYVRIFSRIPNWKYTSAITTEYEMYKDNGALISAFQTHENDFENHISKLSFARNIYNDDITQIVYTDDIDIHGLKDNLGRPLTSIYLTVMKNNAGYKEWYGKGGKNAVISASTVEYSHCFGKLNSGFRLSKESLVDQSYINVMSLNNIDSVHYGLDMYELNGGNPEEEDEILSTDVHFYGDLCCFSPTRLLEEPIQMVEHRFNTAQRELTSLDKAYSSMNELHYDEITSDDYDINDFKVKKTSLAHANQRKEGYCYYPHYEIPLRTLSDDIMSWKPVLLSVRKIKELDKKAYNFHTSSYHFAEKGDKLKLKYVTDNDVIFYNVIVDEVINYKEFDGVVTNENGDIVKLTDFNMIKYKLVKLDEEIPSYARLSNDSSVSYIWRDVIANGFGSEYEIESYPFLNGAFYVESNINFFLKRQDPHNWAKLQSTEFPFDAESTVIPETETNDYYNEDEIVC